jgi:hypothetical protein
MYSSNNVADSQLYLCINKIYSSKLLVHNLNYEQRQTDAVYDLAIISHK